ncbi:serine/threonine protein kinase [Pendulispora rubella]|uniref:Serine/threonine protein kinase n=1 Tax=Pendulispora rubella TaxID=2741070 RepID=A0ABZ2L1C9_9BACT
MIPDDRARNAPGPWGTPDRFGLVGTTLAEKFRVERVVAEGGFGVVYAATQLSLDLPVALKVLKTPPEFNDTVRATWIEMFAREAKTVARLRHPHIVHILDYGVVALPTGGNAPWMALEWLAGETLAGALRVRRRKAGGRSPGEALQLMRPVFEAVAFAHEHGIAHRDLKPENIMLLAHKRGPLARLMDFGIAKAMAEGEVTTSGATHTQGTFAVFSPQYAAPEQITRARTGPWTDVHALALILTEVLTDQRPYDSAADPSVLYPQVLASSRPTPARRGVDVGPWEAVLTRALALRPADRYPDAGAFLAALDEAMGLSTVLPRQASLTEPSVIVDPSLLDADAVATGPRGFTGSAPRRISSWAFVMGGALGAGVLAAATTFLVHHVRSRPCDETFTCPEPSQQICSLKGVCETSHAGVADTTVTLVGAGVRRYQVARLFTLMYRQSTQGRTMFQVGIDNAYTVRIDLPPRLTVGTFPISLEHPMTVGADKSQALLFAANFGKPGWPGRFEGGYLPEGGNVTLTAADDRYGGGFEGRAEIDFVGGADKTSRVHVSMHFRATIKQ